MRSSLGFTLVELAIVLVIVGLVIGGVIVGKSMVRSAELIALTRDFTRYQAAYTNFQGKYDCLPGDCSRVEALFGTNTSGCPNGAATTGTCNGDGDSLIETSGPENRRAWQQLALSGLIAGAYNGFNYDLGVGGGIPRAPFQNAGFVFYYMGGEVWYYGRYGNTLWAARDDTGDFEAGFLAPPEAQRLDAKLDDGYATSGKFVAVDGHSSLGQTNCVDAGNLYAASVSDFHCRVGFIF